jgi:hypothetical protein
MRLDMVFSCAFLRASSASVPFPDQERKDEEYDPSGHDGDDDDQKGQDSLLHSSPVKVKEMEPGTILYVVEDCAGQRK